MARPSDLAVTGTNNPNKQASVDWANDLVELLDGGLTIAPEWFGVVEGAGDAAQRTANDAAWADLETALAAAAVNANGTHRGIPSVEFGAGIYEFSTTFDLNKGTFRIFGQGAGHLIDPSAPTVLKFYDCTGIRYQHRLTSGADTVDGTAHNASNYTVISDLAIRGNYAGTEAEHHGVHARATPILNRVKVTGFAGDGFKIDAETTTVGGDATLWRLTDCSAISCRHGLHVVGNNTNAGYSLGFNAKACRRIGILDESTIGNIHIVPHFSANGWIDAYGSTPTMVHHSGFRYYCRYGEEPGASTNAPTGAATSNQWWGYIAAGGEDATLYPTWVSGTTYRSGGCFVSTKLASPVKVLDGYAEGNQGKAQPAAKTQIDGGALKTWVDTQSAGGFTGMNSSGEYEVSNRFRCLKGLRVNGAAPQFGPITGTTENNTTFFNNTSANTVISFRRFNSAGVIQGTDGTITVTSALMRINAAGSTGIQLQVAGTTEGTVDASGFNLASGNVYKVNGTQVVGAQQSAIADHASDATVNAILTALRTHGLIAT